MTKQTIAYSLYYLLILTLVGWKVVDTLITGAVVVGHKHELRHQMSKQAQLRQELVALESSLQSAQSLSSISDQELSSYRPISQPLTVNLGQAVALR